MDELESADSQVTSNSVPEDVISLKPGRAILITFIFYTVQFILTFYIFLVAVVFHGTTRTEITPDSLWQLQLNVIVPASAVAFLSAGFIAFTVTRRTLHGSIRSGGLQPIGWSPAPPRAVSLSAILGLILAFFYVFVLMRLHPLPTGQTSGLLAAAAEAGGWQRACWAVLAILVAPPVEEFVFRGVLLSGLRRSMGIALAGTIVTVLFVVSHATEALGYWPAWIAITLLCALAVTVRYTSKSLLPPLVLHATYNAGLVLMVYLGAA